MKRLMSVLSVCAIMAMLMMALVSPAMADVANGFDNGCIGVVNGDNCIGVGDDDFDDDDDFDNNATIDDCDFVRPLSGDEALFRCDVDFG